MLFTYHMTLQVDGEEECKGKKCGATRPTLSLDEEVKELNRQLIKENQNLHRLNTKLHESSHFLSLRQAEFDEKLNAEETKNEELQKRLHHESKMSAAEEVCDDIAGERRNLAGGHWLTDASVNEPVNDSVNQPIQLLLPNESVN